MAEDKRGTPGLEAAYALTTPEDSRRYYGDGAERYDQEFAQTMGYVFPRLLVERFRAEGGAAMTPILDVGAGTGLVAEGPRGEGLVIDAVDISRQMLAVAGAKGLYRHRIVADLTKPLAAYYEQRGVLRRIDAVGALEEVFARLWEAVESVRG